MDLIEALGIAVVVILVLFAAFKTALTGATRSCPNCGERIRASVKQCRFCGADTAKVSTR